jgi:hypothetical protein
MFESAELNVVEDDDMMDDRRLKLKHSSRDIALF